MPECRTEHAAGPKGGDAPRVNRRSDVESGEKARTAARNLSSRRAR